MRRRSERRKRVTAISGHLVPFAIGASEMHEVQFDFSDARFIITDNTNALDETQYGIATAGTHRSR